MTASVLKQDQIFFDLERKGLEKNALGGGGGSPGDRAQGQGW